MIFSYGSRRLRTNASSFCRAAVLANSEISSVDCRLSLGSLVHWRMIFRRASRCFFITSCIGRLLEVKSGSAYQEALCHFGSFRAWRGATMRSDCAAYGDIKAEMAVIWSPAENEASRRGG